MKVRIKRIEKDLPLPKFETRGSVGFDIYSRVEVKIGPREIVALPSNLIIETPQGYMLMVAPRSSTAKRLGLMLANGVAIVDNDFCGETDEFLIQVYNFTENEVVVQRGDRIAQGIFVRVNTAEWEETEKMDNICRGGIGSTTKPKI